VIVDLRQRRVSLFNDRFGFNRIYYHENPEALLFIRGEIASEGPA